MARRWLLLLTALALPACDGGDGSGGSPPGDRGSAAASSSSAPLRLSAPLSGGQEVPPVLTFGNGSATFFVPSDRQSLRFDLAFTNLTGVTSAGLHLGARGADGPLVFSLSDQPFVSPLSGTLTAGDLQPQSGFLTFGEALDALMRGRLYVEVRTLAWPGGEIRGQAGPATFQTTLAGFTVLPAVSTPAAGAMVLVVDAAQESIGFTLDVANLGGPATGARLHVAPPGLNGPAVFELAPAGFASSLSGTLTAADLRPQPLAGVTDFADVVDALLRGDAYVTVSTASFPMGEIRGNFAVGGPPPASPMTPAGPTVMFDPVTGQIVFVAVPLNTNGSPR
jgi:hypothetical protein